MIRPRAILAALEEELVASGKVSILLREAVLFCANPGFRAAALAAWRRILTQSLLQEARHLVPAIRQADLERAGQA